MGLPPPAMGRFDRPARQRRRAVSIRYVQAASGRRWARIWPGIAVLGLLLVTGSILLFNQQHSGDPLKVRREMRKF